MMKKSDVKISRGVTAGAVIVILMTASLNLATVRKKDNPVLKTQTDPILLKDKMEEIKDGEKGAPTPSFKWYAFNWFQTDSPASKQEDDLGESGGNAVPDWGAPIPEPGAGQNQDDFWSDDNLWNFDEKDQSQPVDADKKQTQEEEKDWWEEI